jgi:heavy metal efflux system protein
VQRPLATVVVGGMLLGPILLLIVVPALQSLFLSTGSEFTDPPLSNGDAALTGDK